MGVWPFCICINGGVSLASKRNFSTGLELPELIDLVKGFEVANSVRIRLRGEMTTFNGVRDIQWTAEAFEQTVEHSGALPLVYVSVRCLEQRLVTMEAVLMQLLYALDFQLALRELPKADTES